MSGNEAKDEMGGEGLHKFIYGWSTEQYVMCIH